MMSEHAAARTETRIQQLPIQVETWQTLMEAIMQKTEWSPETSVFAYTESLDRCAIEQLCLIEVPEPNTPFEGRMFDATTEARWRRLADDRWTAYIIREHRSEGQCAYRTIRRYYLQGVRDDRNGDFREARYPGKRFVYPVHTGDVARTRDRAYIEVAEYWRTEPEWADLDDNDAALALAQPLLIAHRFIGVAAGSDEDTT